MNASARAWLLSLIERTPLFELGGIAGLTESRLWAQCEFFAPTGSHKDRMYLHIIRQLEAEGRIAPGAVLLDYTSGNGGAALAFVARVLGYGAIIVRPEGLSFGKAAQITSLGARLVETPQAQGVEGAIQGAKALADRLGSRCFFIDQGELPSNSESYEELGRTLSADLKARGAEVNYFVCSVGTGGTFSGLARVIKVAYPNVQCIAVDIEGQTALSHTYGGQVLSSDGHGIEGVSVGKIFSQVDTDLIDGFIVVRQAEAIEACRLLWSEHQLLAGFSSGANLAAISKLPTSGVLTVFFDSMAKYYDDHELFARPIRDRRSSLHQVMDWFDLLG